jgi:hypothetical protein
MTTPNVLSILKELSAALGKETVTAACEQFIGGKKKEKKERKPRGKSTWNLEVDKVLEEMQAAAGEGEKVTYKMAYAEASRRKREGDPEAQAKYEAYRAKVEAKRAEKAAAKGGAAAAEPAPEPAYDDAKVYNFLFDLQESGVTNMLGCVPYLQDEFGMEKADADAYRQNYLSKYGELRAKYRPEPAATPQKKLAEAKRAGDAAGADAAIAEIAEKKGRGRPKKTSAA